jgi:starvation-inducible outer membrane lipoprotein
MKKYLFILSPALLLTACAQDPAEVQRKNTYGQFGVYETEDIQ